MTPEEWITKNHQLEMVRAIQGFRAKCSCARYVSAWYESTKGAHSAWEHHWNRKVQREVEFRAKNPK